MDADELLDKDAVDLNGLKLGHIDLVRESEGNVLFDVHLTDRARRLLHTPDDVITLSADDVVATDFMVTLREDAQHLLRAGLTPLESDPGRL